MSIQATHDQVLTPAAPARAVIHPVWVRVTHWINVVAMIVMIGSGWEIYNASPLFGEDPALARKAAEQLQWSFTGRPEP